MADSLFLYSTSYYMDPGDLAALETRKRRLQNPGARWEGPKNPKYSTLNVGLK